MQRDHALLPLIVSRQSFLFAILIFVEREPVLMLSREERRLLSRRRDLAIREENLSTTLVDSIRKVGKRHLLLGVGAAALTVGIGLIYSANHARKPA